MPFYTPLRYPGGKRRLASAVVQILAANRLTNVHYAEPYAGGAAVALALLFGEHALTVHINDLSRPVFAFWHSVLTEPDLLCRRVERINVSMAEWRRQRAVYESRETASLSELGFATLFLNRTNRSGIVAGGVIGGKKQTGRWALDARFNRVELVQRIRRVSRYRNRIKIYQADALQFTADVVANLGPRSFVFYDPPYIENSEDLYLDTYDRAGHRALADRVQALEQPWVVTYDHAAVREGLYPTQRRIVYGLSYSAQDRYRAREVMFLADGLALPNNWQSSGRISLTPPRSPYPVYGKMENMKPNHDMEEGPAAASRFQKMVKKVFAAGKPLPSRKPASRKRRRRAKRT